MLSVSLQSVGLQELERGEHGRVRVALTQIEGENQLRGSPGLGHRVVRRHFELVT